MCQETAQVTLKAFAIAERVIKAAQSARHVPVRRGRRPSPICLSLERKSALWCLIYVCFYSHVTHSECCLKSVCISVGTVDPLKPDNQSKFSFSNIFFFWKFRFFWSVDVTQSSLLLLLSLLYVYAHYFLSLTFGGNCIKRAMFSQHGDVTALRESTPLPWHVSFQIQSQHNVKVCRCSFSPACGDKA